MKTNWTKRLLELDNEELEAWKTLKKRYIMSRLIGSFLVNQVRKEKLYGHLIESGFIEDLDMDLVDLEHINEIDYYRKNCGKGEVRKFKHGLDRSNKN